MTRRIIATFQNPILKYNRAKTKPQFMIETHYSGFKPAMLGCLAPFSTPRQLSFVPS